MKSDLVLLLALFASVSAFAFNPTYQNVVCNYSQMEKHARVSNRMNMQCLDRFLKPLDIEKSLYFEIKCNRSTMSYYYLAKNESTSRQPAANALFSLIHDTKMNNEVLRLKTFKCYNSNGSHIYNVIISANVSPAH